MSSLRDKEAFLAVEEMTIGSFEVGIGGVRMGECMSMLAMEDLAFLIVPWLELGLREEHLLELGREGVRVPLVEVEGSSGWALGGDVGGGGCQLRERRKEEHGLRRG
jgi:hypothetical protein